ncbi:hypothetical protein [Bacillus sp. Marseille-Q3570]|uniref:hypothetical protein n=1 Tax=Bacillus sp. Marseille-Q3570 TaxID=2963522 RepID=UPI0021B7477F|nr:hypothetical protein [Bacillus sp. Marseille-Q3570]
MKIRDLYADGIVYNEETLLIVLDYFIYEEKSLHMQDDLTKFEHLLSTASRKINEKIKVYKKNRYKKENGR